MDRGGTGDTQGHAERLALEQVITDKYGRFAVAPVGHTFLLADGAFTGNLGHHTPAARHALEAAGIAFTPKMELLEFMERTGAARTEASSRTGFNVQVQYDLTPEQLRSIGASSDHYATFTYDVHAPDGSASAYGTSFLDFLNEPLVKAALRRSAEKRRSPGP